MSKNSVINYLRMAYKIAHEQWLEGTVAGTSVEAAHWEPPGKAAPIAAEYAHVVTGEDFLFNQVIKGGASPLMMSMPTGLSEPPPPGNWSAWAKRVKVDLPALKAYAEKVYANTDSILAGMSDDDLQTMVDVSSAGLGVLPKQVLITLLLLNAAAHTGEISAIKGVQGLQGYPF
jgi:hypothetical protein